MGQTLGHRLKNLREEYGINQEDLAKVLELDRTTLSLIENDNMPAFCSQVRKICVKNLNSVS